MSGDAEDLLDQRRSCHTKGSVLHQQPGFEEQARSETRQTQSLEK